MHERQARERRVCGQQHAPQRLFTKVHLQLFERDCLGDWKVADSGSSQLSQVRANVQTFSEIFCKRSDVRARGTRHARMKVEGAVKVVLDQLPARFDSFELVNTNVYRFSLNTLTAARELVEFFALDFFG